MPNHDPQHFILGYVNGYITTCFDTFEKERFCSVPHRHGEATGKPETRDETRGASKRTFRARLPAIFTLCIASKSIFSYEFSLTFKIDVLCEASVNFHKMPRLPCHGICTLPPLDAVLTMRCKKIRSTTRRKCCACHAK